MRTSRKNFVRFNLASCVIFRTRNKCDPPERPKNLEAPVQYTPCTTGKSGTAYDVRIILKVQRITDIGDGRFHYLELFQTRLARVKVLLFYPFENVQRTLLVVVHTF